MEQEQNTVLRLQLEISQHKQETERKLSEKDDEMDSLRLAPISYMVVYSSIPYYNVARNFI